MNISSICNEFAKLNYIDKFISYKYEPQAIKLKKDWSRHINFKDFKDELRNELTTYGFSPFVLDDYLSQRQNPNLMKYRPKDFNYGLLNFVHKSHAKNLKQFEEDEAERKIIRLKKKQKSEINTFINKKYNSVNNSISCREIKKVHFNLKDKSSNSLFITKMSSSVNNSNDNNNTKLIKSQSCCYISPYTTKTSRILPMINRRKMLEIIEKSPKSIFKRAIKFHKEKIKSIFTLRKKKKI